MKTLWLDVDGVLLDYTRPFLAFTGIDTLGITYDNLFDYDLTKLFRSPDDCELAMLRFAMSKDFDKLQAIADVHDLATLKNMGYSLRVITQLPAPPEAKKARIRNLTQNFGAIFDAIVFTVPGQCKLELIQQSHQPGERTILVEDNPNLLRKADCQSHNIEVYAVGHPYNMDAIKDLNNVPVGHDFSRIAGWIVHDEL